MTKRNAARLARHEHLTGCTAGAPCLDCQTMLSIERMARAGRPRLFPTRLTRQADELINYLQDMDETR